MGKYDGLRRPHFDKRCKMLQKINGFWKAAMCGHPNGLVHQAEVEALVHIQDLDLRENIDKNGSFEVRVTLSENSLFKERALVKKVTYADVQNVTITVTDLTAAGE